MSLFGKQPYVPLQVTKIDLRKPEFTEDPPDRLIFKPGDLCRCWRGLLIFRNPFVAGEHQHALRYSDVYVILGWRARVEALHGFYKILCKSGVVFAPENFLHADVIERPLNEDVFLRMTNRFVTLT